MDGSAGLVVWMNPPLAAAGTILIEVLHDLRCNYKNPYTNVLIAELPIGNFVPVKQCNQGVAVKSEISSTMLDT